MVCVGDDWAGDHHDVELVDAEGRRLARARLPEGLDGVARLHALIAGHMPPAWAELDPGEAAGRVRIGIESDRGPWVAALVAAGYQVYPINPMSVARYRQRHSTSGAKSDGGDAYVLAEVVRLDHAQHRPVAGDSAQVEAMKLVARTHQTLIWDRSRQLLGLGSVLREFFPAALHALDDLTAPDALELLSRAPDPDRAAQLSRSQIAAALRRANRRDVQAKATRVQELLRAAQLRQPTVVQAAYAAVVTTQVRLIAALNAEVDQVGQVVAGHFGRHRDAERYLSQPASVWSSAPGSSPEFGDDPHRFTNAKARRNYAGTSPITRAFGTRKVVLARYARNRRLGHAVHQWAFCAMRGAPGARAYYQAMRSRGIGHQAALRQLGNRLVGILHGCLKTNTSYDEATAWTHLQASS
jgi:hypothetical protein